MAETIDAIASVEAEYGDYCVEGRQVTLAHHGSRSHNPAPCNTPGVPVLEGGVILVSHLDLDAAGGVFALMGEKKEDKEFWAGAERIDVNGLHHMHELPQEVQDKLNAYYAWKDKLPRIRYSEITDVTEEFLSTRDALAIILDEGHPKHKEMIEEGIAWERASRERVESKLIAESEYVRCFVTDGVFCAAAYYSPNYERIVPATVVCNTVYRSITVAFADGGKRLSAREIVQGLWGQEAGGHNGIAGSPRSWNVDEKRLMVEYEKCRKLVEELVREVISPVHSDGVK